MANENAFKIIDIEDAIALYKMGLIDEDELIQRCAAILKNK